ncbi:MAG: stage III sporulation protein AA [Firmicutes bacterium]|nr:stage III sporulation protein AA [Bacillota bacterium]
MDEVLPCLPPGLRGAIAALPKEQLDRVCEIRLRTWRPVMLMAGDDEIDTSPPYVFTEDDALITLQLIACGSLYAFEDDLRQGYITICGGHRVGLAGRVVLYNGRISTLKDISGFCIRIAHEVLGAADSVMKYLIKPPRRLYHTLIISPPRCGKTTLLRDVARQASDGVPSLNFRGVRVGIADERSEIAACYKGIPQATCGIRTDVLDACPKAEGMIMLIRSMSPDVVITDEIGREEDALAIREVMCAGVSLVATAHGGSLEEVARRPALKCLFEGDMFERAVILSQAHGPGTVEAILDVGTEKNMFAGPLR